MAGITITPILCPRKKDNKGTQTGAGPVTACDTLKALVRTTGDLMCDVYARIWRMLVISVLCYRIGV